MDKKILRYIAIAGLSLIIMTPDAKSATCAQVCTAVQNLEKGPSLSKDLCENLLRDGFLPLNSNCGPVCPFDVDRLGVTATCLANCECRVGNNNRFKEWLEKIPSNIS